MIDNNGYILISEDNMNDTGRFFGELEGSIMEVMVKEGIFNKITIYDYQGLCKNETRGNETNSEGSANGLISVSNIKRDNPKNINVNLIKTFRVEWHPAHNDHHFKFPSIQFNCHITFGHARKNQKNFMSYFYDSSHTHTLSHLLNK